MPKPVFKLASFNRRVSAKLIDAAVSLGLLLPGMIAHYIMDWSDGWLAASILAAILYWLFGDAMNGQSIGKRMQDLKVVDYEHGYACPMVESMMRNLMFFKTRFLFHRLSQATDDMSDEHEAALGGQIVIDLRTPLEDPCARKTIAQPQAGTLRPPSNIDLDGIAQFVRSRRKTDDP